ncbi:MAG: regulatory protein RecX [Methylobacter sp.]
MFEEDEADDLHDVKDIKDVCLRLLARREHSRKELLDKLALRGFDRDEAVLVIDELAQQGWQDDARYAENYARFRIHKGYGPIRIGYELRQNGIAVFDLDAIVQQEAGGWMALLEQVYRKKYSGGAELTRSEWAKRSRFLLHRGFSGAMISTLFDELEIKLL